jgi:hypothetical protein
LRNQNALLAAVGWRHFLGDRRCRVGQFAQPTRPAPRARQSSGMRKACNSAIHDDKNLNFQ